MPRSKNPQTYPPILFQIVSHTVNSSSRLDFVFPTEREAKRFQQEWYSFLNALEAYSERVEKANPTGRITQMVQSARPWIASFAELAGPTFRITLEPKETLSYYQALEHQFSRQTHIDAEVEREVNEEAHSSYLDDFLKS